MSDAQTLELIEVQIDPIAKPTHSLILADRSFMSTLAKAEQEGAGLAVIKDAVGAQAAASLQGRVTKAQTLLNKSRLDLIRPYKTLIDSINEAAKQPDARLQSLKDKLSIAQTIFNQQQAKLIQEAEQKRLKDLRDLEDKLAREKKEAQDKADKIAADLKAMQEAAEKIAEAARLAGLPVVPVLVVESWDDDLPVVVPQKTATELEIERVKFAPAAVVARPSGVRTITTLVPFVTDVNKLPDIFVDKTARIAQIRSVFCVGYKAGDPMPVLEGCRFEVQTSTQSTGKSQF